MNAGSINPTGIFLDSRYDEAREITIMERAVAAINDAPWINNIVSIWCDSKAGAFYSVKCRDADEYLDDIVQSLKSAFRKVGGGYNEIMIEGDNRTVWAGAYWVGDDIMLDAGIEDSPPQSSETKDCATSTLQPRRIAMYNLLMWGSDGFWDGKPVTIGIDRFLEYTNDSIKERLKSLSDNIIEELKS